MKVLTLLSSGHMVTEKHKDVRKVGAVEGAEGSVAVITVEGLLKVNAWWSNRSVLPPSHHLSPPPSQNNVFQCPF